MQDTEIKNLIIESFSPLSLLLLFTSRPLDLDHTFFGQWDFSIKYLSEMVKQSVLGDLQNLKKFTSKLAIEYQSS